MPKSHHSKFFPGKLRVMLDQVDELGLSHGSSWVSEGRVFAIHDPDVFMNDIAPQFFDKQTHLRSFHRQLSIWGYTRLETGAGGRGVWFHKHFIRDKPELIKHIKRVPVKNPKPTMATPKNQLPDYTNYQMPVSFHQDSLHSTTKGPHATAKLVPVHQPHRNVAAAVDAATAKGGLPESKLLPAHINPAHIQASMPPPPPGTLEYLAALGRMPPPPVAPRYFYPHNAVLPVPTHHVPPPPPPIVSDQARRYPSFILTNYNQPPPVTSMNPLPVYSADPSIPPSNDLGEVAQQLMAYRNQTPPQPQMSLGDGNNHLNAAILARLMDSHRLGNPTANNGVGLNSQDLLSAIALQNFLRQGP